MGIVVDYCVWHRCWVGILRRKLEQKNGYHFVCLCVWSILVVKIGCCFPITENVNRFTKRERGKQVEISYKFNVEFEIISNELLINRNRIWSVCDQLIDVVDLIIITILYERMQRKLFFDIWTLSIDVSI